jgi:hypothetical protein
VRRLTQRPFSTCGTRIDLGTLDEHLYREKSGWAVQTLLQEALGCRPAFIDEPLKRPRWQPRPELSTYRPVLLKERAEGRLVKPEQPDVCRVVKGVLRATDPLKILVVEPIHICVGIPRVARPTIDIAPVH